MEVYFPLSIITQLGKFYAHFMDHKYLMHTSLLQTISYWAATQNLNYHSRETHENDKSVYQNVKVFYEVAEKLRN